MGQGGRVQDAGALGPETCINMFMLNHTQAESIRKQAMKEVVLAQALHNPNIVTTYRQVPGLVVLAPAGVRASEPPAAASILYSLLT